MKSTSTWFWFVSEENFKKVFGGGGVLKVGFLWLVCLLVLKSKPIAKGILEFP